MGRALPILLALAIAWPAAAAESHLTEDGKGLVLHPGERATVRLGSGGRLTLVSAEPAPREQALPPGPGRPGTMADPPRDLVVFQLGGSTANDAVLKIESGLSRAFDYRAALSVDRAGKVETSTTSVCTVLPLLATYEQWPYAVRSIRIEALTPRTTNEVVCGEAKIYQPRTP